MAASLMRKIARVVTLPAPSPGFLGEGHTAIEVLNAKDITGNDPFVLLMDDRLDIGSQPRKLGGAHPHAGIETVTLFLEGTFVDPHEGNTSEGDLQWMTAGKGIIHGENIVGQGHTRILQLWVRLPRADRNVEPRVQLIKLDTVPVRTADGVVARVYSGTSGNKTSDTLNYAPVTMVDFSMEPNAVVDQELPASYNGFVYVLDGGVTVANKELTGGQVGWLEVGAGNAATMLRLVGGSSGGRAILYAGQPQREPLIHQGPFVAGDRSEMQQLFGQYQSGSFKKLSELGGLA